MKEYVDRAVQRQRAAERLGHDVGGGVVGVSTLIVLLPQPLDDEQQRGNTGADGAINRCM